MPVDIEEVAKANAMQGIDVSRPTVTLNMRVGKSLACLLGIIAVVQGTIQFADLLGNPQPPRSHVATFVMFLISALLVVVGLWLAVRSARICVFAEGGRLHIRNLFKSYVVPLSEVREFSLGYQQAKLPGSETQGAARLVSGDTVPMNATSAGTLFGTGKHEAEEILRALNALLVAGR